MTLRRALALASRSMCRTITRELEFIFLDKTKTSIAASNMLTATKFPFNFLEYRSYNSIGNDTVAVMGRCGLKTSAMHATSLADVVSTEVNYEKENYKQPEELATGPPPPFTLSESPGDVLLTLNGTYGDEKIAIDVSIDDQPEEEPYEMDEEVIDVDTGVVFTVTIAKENSEDSLVFEIKSDGEYMEILHIGMESNDGNDDETAYFGPTFEELDPALQQELDVYLKARGINPELGAYLVKLVNDKEQRCYMEFLNRLYNFVGK